MNEFKFDQEVERLMEVADKVGEADGCEIGRAHV